MDCRQIDCGLYTCIYVYMLLTLITCFPKNKNKNKNFQMASAALSYLTSPLPRAAKRDVGFHELAELAVSFFRLRSDTLNQASQRFCLASGSSCWDPAGDACSLDLMSWRANGTRSTKVLLRAPHVNFTRTSSLLIASSLRGSIQLPVSIYISRLLLF